MRRWLGAAIVSVLLQVASAVAQTPETFPLPDGAAPSGLAVDRAGAIWFLARPLGAVGRLDPATGHTRLIPLGHGAQPSALALGPDGIPFVADAVENIVYQVDPNTDEVIRHPIDAPGGPLELNGLIFDGRERLWLTGYSGYFGWLEPHTGRSAVLPAPGGRGPIGLASDGGQVWFSSYATDAVVRVDPETLRTDVFLLPSGHEGPKALTIAPGGQLWLTAYQSGALLRLEPTLGRWQAWPLPGEEARPNGLALDPQGTVVVSDVGQSLLHIFDPGSQAFAHAVGLGDGCMGRTILGSADGVWVAEARCDQIRRLNADQLGASGSP